MLTVKAKRAKSAILVFTKARSEANMYELDYMDKATMCCFGLFVLPFFWLCFFMCWAGFIVFMARVVIIIVQ